MADLIKDPLKGDDQEGLEEDELKILSEAGILQGSSKALGKRKAKHIVFADSAEEGVYSLFFLDFLTHKLMYSLTQHVSLRRRQAPSVFLPMNRRL